MSRHRWLSVVLVLVGVAVAGGACSDSGDDSGAAGGTPSTTAGSAGQEGAPAPLVFNGQGNDLDVYATEPDPDGTFPTQRLITTAAEDPVDGLDINGQICFFGDGTDRFVAGEDTNQPDPPAGWGIFRLEGRELGSLSATQLGKLTPTYQAGESPENYGCGILSDGRVLTTDVGNQAGGPPSGQLIIWFPPFDSREVAYCKLDVGLATGQSILVVDDVVYVASARGGVFRYEGPFPTGADAAGGCGRVDPTGAPLADAVDRTEFIVAGDNDLATPAGLAPAPDGGMYVSSVFNGIINEYGPTGEFRRRILEPPAGEVLGAEPYSTGTPLGIGVGPDGTLYYADIGIVVEPGELPGPGPGTGTVRRIVFTDGEPQPPETMADGLAFPDGIGVWDPGAEPPPG